MACRGAGLRVAASSISTSVSTRVRAGLRARRAGTVLAAFARSAYLDLDGHLVAVVASELLNGPLNVVVPLPAGVTLQELSAGGPAAGDASALEIGGAMRVDLAAARLWDARVPALEVGAAQREGLRTVRAIVEQDAPRESLARAGRRTARAAEAMAALADGLRRGDPGTVGQAARDLAGRGPGLTPAGDDALAGALVAVAVARPRDAVPLRAAVIGATEGRTTRISAAYLRAAAAGEAGEAWHALLRALAGEAGTLEAAVQAVLAFGETSGADMLAGFLLAMEALAPS